MLRAWEQTVQPQDTVYVLGDVTGTSATGRVEHALGLLRNLPGRKHLVAGNHDPVHPMHRRSFARWMPAYLEVFDTVTPFLRRRIGGHEIALSHFPYAEYGEGPYRGGADLSRHDQWRLPDLGLPIIHGHTHQPERFHVEPPTPFKRWHSIGVHVGVDAWDLAPAAQDEVIAILNTVIAANKQAARDGWTHVGVMPERERGILSHR